MSYLDNLLKNEHRQMIGLGSILCVSNNTILNGAATVVSNLYVSGNAILNNSILNSNINILGSLNTSQLTGLNINISGNVILNNSNIINSLNISGNCNITNSISINSLLTILGNVNIYSKLINNSNLYVSNNTILNNTTINSNLFINNNSIISNATINTNLSVSNNSILNNLSINSNLYVSNNSILNNVSINSNLYVSGTISLNSATVLSSLYVSGNYNCHNNVLILNNSNIISNLSVLLTSNFNNVNIKNTINCPLLEYDTNTSAAAAGIPYWGLYRTGDVVKIRLDINTPIITLNGSAIYNLYLGDTYTELGGSVYHDLGEVLPITITGTVNTNIAGTYILLYSARDSFNNISNNITRTINVYNSPTINNITLSSNIISIITSNYYDIMSYTITQSNNIIVSETIITTNTIDISGFDNNTYYITIYLKKTNNTILWYSIFDLTNNILGSVLNIKGGNPLNFPYNNILNLFTGITASNILTNTLININNSNIVIKNKNNQVVSTPSNGIISTTLGDIYYITLTIIGSNNITITTTRQINIINTIPPIITLLGISPLPLYLGTSFVDPGATAVDILNNSIIPTVSGIINPNNSGYYNLTYTAIDNSNNTSTIVRPIIVSDKTPIYRFALIDTNSDSNLYRGRVLKFNTSILSSISNNWTMELWCFHYFSIYNGGILTTEYNSGNNSFYPPSNSNNLPINGGFTDTTLFTLVNNNSTIFKLNYANGVTCDLYTSFTFFINWSTGGVSYTPQGIICSIAPNSWNHLAISYDGSVLRFFCNGVLLTNTFNISNAILVNPIGPETLYIGSNSSSSDINIQNNTSKYGGYLSQLCFHNYCKYTNNFIPSNNLKPTNLYSCGFYLDDNYTDLITANVATILDNGIMPLSIAKVYRLNLRHPNLIYEFPGGTLANTFWCLHNKLLGKSWSNIDKSVLVYNTNQNYSNGISAVWDFITPYDNPPYEFANLSFTYPFSLYIGPNPDNILLESLVIYVIKDSNDFSTLTIKSKNYTGSTMLNYNYGNRTRVGKFLFTLTPQGIIKLYYNNTLVFNDNMTSSNIPTLSGNGIWLGRYNNNNNVGIISNIKIFNNIIPWAQIF